MRIVIIGNGVAGMEAALTVRRAQPDWEVTLVSEESDHFFSRTALMWVLSGQLSHRDIGPHERDIYDRMGFRRVRARAMAVDVEARQVTLNAAPGALRYDRLLVASGSRPRRAPWDGAELLGVGHFVTMQDLEWLERELHGGPGYGGRPPRPDHHVAACPEGSPYRPRPSVTAARGREPHHPAVIGGGLIGIEAVEVMVAAGLPPHFFIREEWFWPMAINRAEATHITARMREHGVYVHTSHEVEQILGDEEGHVSAVVTHKGRQDTDLVVVAIGVVPNTEWLRGSGIAMDEAGGILVDAGLATPAPGVWAAGDCVAVPWFDGRQRPEPLWYTARDQGRVAGRRLLGEDASYARGVFYNSAKLMDVEYTTAGLVGFDLTGEREWFFEETGPVRSTSRIVIKDGAVIGFNFLGRRWDQDVLITWIREGRSLEWVLSNLEEARFDTELVPPLRLPDGEPTLSEPNPGSGTFADASPPS